MKLNSRIIIKIDFIVGLSVETNDVHIRSSCLQSMPSFSEPRK
ncbi:hypothetical protein NARC_70059 [Candidatus Nitrosocosmicus arcticus]|uniref:Uncharacterized protein n=1 Tax=Candidatus Nitrosocosmicus arcticus TaxID=2035267 RepID=A0A557SV77_9ARCH|nr:hypothetical protein NARC_70059 [Candidatus Nitrosocosmicus arcticus]